MTSRNEFRDYIDNNGENVPEELKQVFMCVDSLSVSTADCYGALALLTT